MSPVLTRPPSARLRLIASAGFAACASLGLASSAPAADWLTFDGNASRSAWLRTDTSITGQNVQRLRRRWVTALDHVADSTPIFAEHVSVGAAQSAAMLFQTDEAGTTYGINASSGSVIWRFKTSGPKITASTPVLDGARSALYVPGVDGYVHVVDPATGMELHPAGFPAQVTLIPNTEKDASPLNLANGYLYAATSGYFGDAPPYDGHVVAVHLRNGTARVFNSLCSNLHMLLTTQCPAQRSGIWARGGVVVDPDPSMHGRIYAATGNGPCDAATFDYGDSVLSLTASAARMADYFTPTDCKQLSNQDIDLGSTGPAMLPKATRSKTPLMAVQGGKEHVLYLLDRTHLGNLGGQLQSVSLPGELFSAPAVWSDSSGQTWIYLGVLPDSTDVMALTVTTDSQGRSTLQRKWTSLVGGTSPIVINGVVFVAASGVLSALNALSGAGLWSSTNPSVGGTIGSVHWQSPIAVDGCVYISDENSNLSAYCLK